MRGASNGLNVMTIEDPIEYELSALGESISQAQVNSKKGVTFANGLRHILRQDPDVIMVGEIRDEPTARIAVQASLTGHLVLSTLHTNDSVGAITRLADLGIERFSHREFARGRHGAAAGPSLTWRVRWARMRGLRRHRLPRPDRPVRVAEVDAARRRRHRRRAHASGAL
jgi:Flp pilus assembly CpaF family ATPase